MRTQITQTQLSVLESKRERFKALLAKQDQIHREAAELLGIDGATDGYADDFLSDCLNGLSSVADLVDLVGLEVER